MYNYLAKQLQPTCCLQYNSADAFLHELKHVYNVFTMQFLSGISRNTQSRSDMLSLPTSGKSRHLAECVWDFQNDVLWDTHQNAPLLFAQATKQALCHAHTSLVIILQQGEF